MQQEPDQLSCVTHIKQDSKGNHYLWEFKRFRYHLIDRFSCFTIRRWDPATQSPIPRIRTSKKLRLKLKRLLCSAVSSNSTSAPALSTSPA
jgi:hypothetical protein